MQGFNDSPEPARVESFVALLYLPYLSSEYFPRLG